MHRDKFKTKQGLLTKYALACGYQEINETKQQVITRLYQEHGCYVVSQYDHFNHERLFMDGFRTLTEARKVYFRLKREANKVKGENHANRP